MTGFGMRMYVCMCELDIRTYMYSNVYNSAHMHKNSKYYSTYTLYTFFMNVYKYYLALLLVCKNLVR